MKENTSLGAVQHKPKRGRQPVGERAMSSAERKRRSREHLAEQGSVEFTVRLQGHLLAFLDDWATTTQQSRADVLQEIVEVAVGRMRLIMQRAQQMREDGATPEQIAAEMYQSMLVPGVDELSPNALNKIREAIK